MAALGPVQLACISPRGATDEFDLVQAISSNGWNLSGFEQPGVAGTIAASALDAAGRIYPYVRMTPLMAAPFIGAEHGCTAYLKLESEQVTGSFKARGAVAKVTALCAADLAAGLVTSSTGNHGLALAYACAAVPAAAAARRRVYVPRSAVAVKMAKLRAQGAEVAVHGDDCLESELEGAAVAAAECCLYVSPYNDADIIAGQGTVALELLAQLTASPGASAASVRASSVTADGPAAESAEHEGAPQRGSTAGAGSAGAHGREFPAGSRDPAGAAPLGGEDLVVFVPVGGGGLAAGIAGVLKGASCAITVVGCQPEASQVMKLSVEAGHVVDAPSLETLSDGTAGGVDSEAITLRPCTECIDEWETASETEIAAAMVDVLAKQSKLVEGSAAVAVAVAMRQARSGRLRDKRAVIICCGGNVALEKLQHALTLAQPVAAS